MVRKRKHQCAYVFSSGPAIPSRFANHAAPARRHFFTAAPCRKTQEIKRLPQA